MAKTVFLIFGANRSGTSVLAGSLLRCGVTLDFEHESLEARLRKEDHSRPDGGYESYEIPLILKFLRQVMANSGGCQGNPVLPEELRFTSRESLAVSSLMETIPRFPFAIKDPLLTFQYLKWKTAVVQNRVHISLIPVVSLRPPLEQAYALLRRGFCKSLRSGLDLWLRYYAEVRYLIQRGESPRIILYDGVERNFLDQIEVLCADFSLAYHGESVRDFFQPGCEHRYDPMELNDHPLATAIGELYLDLEARSLIRLR